MNNQLAFEAINITKYFGNFKALEDINLSSEQGQIFCLLGPNGAGKTTLVNMLSTLSEPTKGNLKVLGVDVVKNPQKVRELIGLAGQYAAVDEYLTGEENLYMIARLYHLSTREARVRTKQLLEDLRLPDAANKQVRAYSGGMRRRLDLGASLVGRPKILFLDEPTTGLDPRTRLELWEIIRRLVKEGTSILLTTQYLEEADELADHIAVIDRGKLIAEGTSKQLKSQLGGDVIKIELVRAEDADKVIEAVKDIASKTVYYDDSSKMVNVPVGGNGSKHLIEVVRALDKIGTTTNSLALHQPTLDDVFLNLTGSKASELDNQEVPQKRKRNNEHRL
jgi:ABC-2 type transport system ATP-binding protein